MAVNLNIVPPDIGRFAKTYDISLVDQTATSANYILGAINAGASLGFVARRLIIWNIGAMTAPQKTVFELVRLTAASSGGAAFTPQPYDTGNTFSGIALTGNPTVTAAATPIARFSVWTPAAVGAFNPIDINLVEWGRQAMYIPAGVANGLALRVSNGAVGATGLDVSVVFTEENF